MASSPDCEFVCLVFRLNRCPVEWCLMPLSTVFQSYHGHSSHYSCLSWVSPVLGWGSELKSRSHGLWTYLLQGGSLDLVTLSSTRRDWHFVWIGRCRSKVSSLTLSQTIPGFYVSAVQVFWKHCGKRRNCSLRAISPFPAVFSSL